MFFDHVPIYFIVASGTASFCLIWGMLRAKKIGLDINEYLDLYLTLIFSAFLGARLFHVVYENPEFYRLHPMQIFYFWNGGFIYFGGFIAAILIGLLFLKIKKSEVNYGTYFDLLTPLISFSYAIGRLGCFSVGCCYGKQCSLPWAINGRHPTQLYAFFWEIILCLIILSLEKHKLYLKRLSKKTANLLLTNGSVFLIWLLFHSLGRLLMENYRDDFRGPIFLISISSWISIACIYVSIYFLIKNIKNKQSL